MAAASPLRVFEIHGPFNQDGGTTLHFHGKVLSLPQLLIYKPSYYYPCIAGKPSGYGTGATAYCSELSSILLTSLRSASELNNNLDPETV